MEDVAEKKKKAESPKPKKASGRKVHTIDRIVARIKAQAPKKGNVCGSVDVARSTKGSISKVKYVLKTGITAFDDLTGGIPFGRLVEFYGPEGGSKTAHACLSCFAAQNRQIYDIESGEPVQIGPDCDVSILYIDNEQSLEDDRLTVNGTLIDCAIARCDTVDQLFKMVDGIIKLLAKIEDESKRKQFLIVVVDTIAGTASKEEMTSEWGKDDYSRAPKQLREGFRTLVRDLNRRNVCMVCTNQISENYKKKNTHSRSNTPDPDDFTPSGGRALKFYSRLRVFIWKQGDYKLHKTEKFPSGFIYGFITVKNNLRKPLRQGRGVLLYDGGLSNIYSMLETFKFLKIAEWTETGTVFKFVKNGVTPTTFGDLPQASADLEEDDEDDDGDSESKVKNPKMVSNREWPQFYELHKKDFDALWKVAVDKCFAAPAQSAIDDAEDIEDDGDEFGDEDE